MQVLHIQQVAEASGGKGIDRSEYAVLVSIMAARNAATSWAEYAFYADQYAEYRTIYAAN